MEDEKPKKGLSGILPKAKIRPSVDSVKQLYMASEHFELSAFFDSVNFDTEMRNIVRKEYPSQMWVKQKKDEFARAEAEKISDAVFSYKGEWHREVLKTLRDYPKVNDAMLKILMYRINEYIRMINEDQEAAQGGRKKRKSEFSKVGNKDLLSLVNAVQILTASKHKSLLVNDWSFKTADSFIELLDVSDDVTKNTRAWNIELLGGENLTGKELQALTSKWYDKPPLPHTQAEIEREREATKGDNS